MNPAISGAAVQPHGALLVLHGAELSIMQVSANSERVLGHSPASLIGAPVTVLGGAFASLIQDCVSSGTLRLPTPVPCVVRCGDDVRAMHATVHREEAQGALVVELEPASTAVGGPVTAEALAAAIGRITSAGTIAEVGAELVGIVRELTGYERVMLHRLEPDGHGAVIAEARAANLPPFVGQHYPVSHVPLRARELYLRSRLRLLVDIGDAPAALVSHPSDAGHAAIDMSFCVLRAASSRHLHFLQSVDVRSTLVTSVVREGRLWGLVVCHDRGRREVPSTLRAACELLSEVLATRIAALESRVEVEAELFGRALEGRLISAAGDTGDWRDALFDAPDERLLRPLNATGAALVCDGEILTTGDVPSRGQLRRLTAWLASSARQPVYQTSALAREHDDFAALTPVATGLLAIELSRGDADYLLLFRREEPVEIVWASTSEWEVRSPEGSWREVVHGTAPPWTRHDLAIASAMRNSLLDVILQLRALRAIIADRQATHALNAIEAAEEPMIIADERGELLVVNEAFHHLFDRPLPPLRHLDDLCLISAAPQRIREALDKMRESREAWRGELRLAVGKGEDWPVALRAEPVPGLRGSVFGYIMIFTDMRGRRDAKIARARLERTIAASTAATETTSLAGAAAVLDRDFDAVLGAILANVSATVGQLTDGSTAMVSPAGDTLRELEVATRRAAHLTSQMLTDPARIQDAS